MENDGTEVEVIQPGSPLVDRIVDDKIVGLRGIEVPLTSGQRLQLNRDLVAEVLNNCFWASLAHEEGRPIASGVTFVGPDEHGMSEPLCLERAEPLTVKSLIRLGTVAGTSHRLAVHEDGGKPVIWGFLRGSGPPYWVSVWFDRPAVLRVMVEGGFLLGMLDRGRILTQQGHAVANRLNVRSQLQNLLGPLRFDVVDALMFIANEMCRHGHGGALLVVSEGSQWDAHVEMKHPLSTKSRTLLSRLSQQIPSSDLVSVATREELGRAILEDRSRAVTQIASLTKVDGAAVIGTDLTVFGFGAVIRTDPFATTKPAIKRRTIYEQDFADMEEWTDLGGTRHQSAALFVAATKTCAAFVSSHDGGLSALAWKEDPVPGHLQWLRGLEALVSPK